MILKDYIEGSIHDLQHSVKIQSEEVQVAIAKLLSECTLNFNLMGLTGEESLKEILSVLEKDDKTFNIFIRSTSAFLANKSLYGDDYSYYCDALVEIIQPVRGTKSAFNTVQKDRALNNDELKVLLHDNPWFVYYLTLHLDYTTSLVKIT